MARSRRHLPIAGCYPHASEKVEKQAASRRLRRIIRENLRRNPEAEVVPIAREIDDAWTWRKDGRGWIGPDGPARWMRK